MRFYQVTILIGRITQALVAYYDFVIWEEIQRH